MKKIGYFTLIFLIGCSHKDLKTNNSSSKPNIVILGETHANHRNEMLMFLEKLQPYAVLLEFPEDLFKDFNKPVNDAEFKNALDQTSIGWIYCLKSKSKCHGFDMQGQDLFNIVTKLPHRQNTAYREFFDLAKKNHPILLKGLDEVLEKNNKCSSSLKLMNTQQCDENWKERRMKIIGLVRKLYKRSPYNKIKDLELIVKLGQLEWERRNKAMAKNICTHSKNLYGKTIAVVVGFGHRYFLRKLLQNCPVSVLDPTF